MGDAVKALRVAILGCGYVGSALGRTLVDAGHSCVGTTTTPARQDAIRRLGLQPMVVRISDTSGVRAVIQRCDAVYWTIGAGRRREAYREVYLDGVASLIEAIGETNVSTVVYTSSTRVYGQDDGSWVNESSPTQPTSEAGKILIQSERRLLDGLSAMGRGVAVLRLSGIYGPGRDPTARIVQQAGCVRNDGNQYVNLVHLDDIVSTMSLLLASSHSGVFNLSDDEPTTRRAYYDRCLVAAGLKPIQWTDEDDDATRGKRVDNTLIKRTLGVTLEHPTH